MYQSQAKWNFAAMTVLDLDLKPVLDAVMQTLMHT